MTKLLRTLMIAAIGAAGAWASFSPGRVAVASLVILLMIACAAVIAWGPRAILPYVLGFTALALLADEWSDASGASYDDMRPSAAIAFGLSLHVLIMLAASAVAFLARRARTERQQQR